AACHGTYGSEGKYPNKVVPIQVVGTDSLRLTKLTKEFRDYYKKTWFGKSGEQGYEYPTGYVAPPLIGVWASAPYFHNGSVPTVDTVLNSEQRPEIWARDNRNPHAYDLVRVGMVHRVLSQSEVEKSAAEAAGKPFVSQPAINHGA